MDQRKFDPEAVRAIRLNPYVIAEMGDVNSKLYLEALKYCNLRQTLNPDFIRTCVQEVKKNGFWLSKLDSREQCPEICIEAIRQDKKSFTWCTVYTPEICLEAIKSDPHNLKIIKTACPQFLTRELYLEAVKRDGDMLQYVEEKEQDLELCTIAVDNKGNSIRFVREDFQNLDLCISAIRKSGGEVLQYVYNLEYVCVHLISSGLAGLF